MIFSIDYMTRFDTKGNMRAVGIIEFNDNNYNGTLMVENNTLEHCVLDTTAAIRSLVKEHYLGKKEGWFPISIFDLKNGRTVKVQSDYWRNNG